ncbi:hypothetical protein, partial [Methylogaea oryzae]|uniref:hypothetical protein n=1 Tax=Methylogaea oryzae TaxID=1295382 RepID=UPI000ABFE6C4
RQRPSQSGAGSDEGRGLSLAAAFGALRQDYETLAADILSLSQTPGLPQDFTAILQQSLRRLDIQIRREEDALLGRAAPDNGQRRRKPKEDKRDWCDCCDCGDCCDCIQCLPNRVCSPCRHSGDSHHGDGCGHCCACDSTCCHGGSCDSGCCDGCGCD